MATEFQMNSYFRDMENACHEFHLAKKAREAEKEELIKAEGFGSEAMKAWYKREEHFSFPFTDGQMKAHRAWEMSCFHNSSELECEELPATEDIADFSSTLQAAGFNTLVVTSQSSALMEFLHLLAGQGWTMEGLCTITRTEDRHGTVMPRPKLGIRVIKN